MAASSSNSSSTRYIWGTAYADARAEDSAELAALSEAAEKILSEKTRTGAALTEAERAVIYHDPAVKLSVAHASHITACPLFDTHQRQVGTILDAYAQGSTIRILAAVQDPATIAAIDRGEKRGLSVGYSIARSATGAVDPSTFAFREVSVCETPFFEGCTIDVAASGAAAAQKGPSYNVSAPGSALSLSSTLPETKRPMASVDSAPAAAPAAPAAAAPAAAAPSEVTLEVSPQKMREILARYEEMANKVNSYEQEYTQQVKPKLDNTMLVFRKLANRGSNQPLDASIEKYLSTPFATRDTAPLANFLAEVASSSESIAGKYEEARDLAETYKNQVNELQRQNVELEALIKAQQSLSERPQQQHQRQPIGINASASTSGVPEASMLSDLFSRPSPLDSVFGSRKRPFAAVEKAEEHSAASAAKRIAVTASAAPNTPQRAAQSEAHNPMQGILAELSAMQNVTMRSKLDSKK